MCPGGGWPPQVSPLTTCSVPSQVEGLMDDIDFKARVSRVDFEAMCADLFERVSRPVQDALATAEMTAVSKQRSD